MKVVVVGIGVVGTALAKFLIWLGFEVICLDDKGSKDLAKIAKDADFESVYDIIDLSLVAKDASVAFIAVPISQIAKIAKELAGIMKRGSLIVSCGSVAEPVFPNVIDVDSITKKGITFALVHFMFKPEYPLQATIFGQNIALAITGRQSKKWQKWIDGLFTPFGPIFHYLDRNKHDLVTTVSQLFHMILAVLAAELWCSMLDSMVTLGLKTGGFPCQSVVQSVLRSMKAPKLIGEILKSHPRTLELIGILRAALNKLENAVRIGNTKSIEQTMAIARSSIGPELLENIDWTAGELLWLQSDFRKPYLVFDFPANMNQLGLLARVMEEFDRLGVNKTSTYAHNLPDGGCRFIVGVKSVNSQVEEATKKVNSWLP